MIRKKRRRVEKYSMDMEIDKTDEQKVLEEYKKIQERLKEMNEKYKNIIDPIPPMPTEAERWYI